MRFEVEAKALAALSHPNIVSVFAIEETGGRLVLVMEFVDGKTLRHYIQPGGMAIVKSLEIAVSLADAIAAAHARGVLHRDLKPENIMMTASGWVKILVSAWRSSAPLTPVTATMTPRRRSTSPAMAAPWARPRICHRNRWMVASSTSTFLLGIHWVADIIAGLAVAVVSLPVAL